MNLLPDQILNGGNVIIRQNESGYRHSIDPILLANFITPKQKDFIIDLGTGCGIMPILLAAKYPDIRALGVEIQAPLFETAFENIRENGFDDRISLLKADIKALTFQKIGEKSDIVITNPPYIKSDSGRINPDEEKAIARHEIKINLKEIISISKDLLKPSGIFAVIYPSHRLSDLFCEMRNNGIEPKIIQSVHAKIHHGAKLVMVQGTKNGNPGLEMRPPLILYNEDGSYTDEIKTVFDNL